MRRGPGGNVGAASQFMTGGEAPIGPAADFFEVVGGLEVDQPSREAADYAGLGTILANFPTPLYISA